jgi:uncharacterized protein
MVIYFPHLTAYLIMKKPPKKKSQIKKIILVLIGMLSLLLGIVGIVIPLLPTTPFLLLTTACFMRSSERLYLWLINHKWFGEYICNYREHKAIPLSTKIIAISFLWLSILYSIFFIVDSIYLHLLLVVIAITVSVHILHFKTLKRSRK